jgi:hypothetical protein
MINMKLFIYVMALLSCTAVIAQKKKDDKKTTTISSATSVNLDTLFKQVRFRSIGPFRGGRSVTSIGVVQNQLVYYMGTTSSKLEKHIR